MKVILKKNINGLGKAGDIKSVADGYARNYLIPKGYVLKAEDKNLAKLEEQKRIIQKKIQKKIKDAKALKTKLEGLSLSIEVTAGSDEKLYGSVTTKDISLALKELNIDIDKRKINLDQPIKKLGIYTIKIHILEDINAEMKVWIINKDSTDK